MKENIYTIPIYKAFEEKCGCPMCKLYDKIETRQIEYVLDNMAIAEVLVRRQTREQGFCRRHLDEMIKRPNKLAVGILLRDHVREITDNIAKDNKFNRMQKSVSVLHQMADDCYVCRNTDIQMGYAVSNTIWLWKKDDDFKKLLKEQPYFCAKHASSLLDCAQKDMMSKQFEIFYADIMSIQDTYTRKLHEYLEAYVNSFDYRFSHIDIGDKKNALEYAEEFLLGKER